MKGELNHVIVAYQLTAVGPLDILRSERVGADKSVAEAVLLERLTVQGWRKAGINTLYR